MRIKEEGHFWQREQQLQRHKEMLIENLVVSGEVWGHRAGKGLGGAGEWPCWRVWGIGTLSWDNSGQERD